MRPFAELSFRDRVNWEKAVTTGIIDAALLRTIGAYIEDLEHEVDQSQDEIAQLVTEIEAWQDGVHDHAAEVTP